MAIENDKIKYMLQNFVKFTTQSNYYQRSISEMMVRRLISDEDIEDLQNAFLIIDADHDGYMGLEDVKKADKSILGD